MPLFDALRRHWTSIAIVVALILSFIFARQDAHKRDTAIRGALVTACAADSKRTALNAAGFAALAERVGKRAEPGDAASARRYRSVATGIVTLIPAPIGREGAKEIGEVRLIDNPGQEPRLIITKRARDLQMQGCKDFYGVG